ncbi:hypothetical protein [Methylorubrum extorquens]|nr:hypothetical protein [Methylorubrum extorquens]
MSPIIGCVDRVDRDGTVVGWAFDPRMPGETLGLILLLDNVRAAECICERARPDAAAMLSITYEAVGFTCQLGGEFFDDTERAISFVHATSGEPVALPGASSVRLPSKSAGLVALDADGRSLTGFVEGHGSSRRLTLVEVVVDGAPARIVSLSSKNADETSVAFKIALPAAVVDSPLAHEISVRHIETGRHLTGSPLFSKVSRRVGSFDTLTGRTVQGWGADLSSRRVERLDLFCDDKFVKQVVCLDPRADVKKVYGIGAGGFTEHLPVDIVHAGIRKIDLRFADGTSVSGSPRYLTELDLELGGLEWLLFGEPAADNDDFADELRSIAQILTLPARNADPKFYRFRTTELAYELIARIIFAFSAERAAHAIVTLALLGVHSCRGAEDFQVVLPVLQRLPPFAPLGLGLIDLERQRRRPLNRLMLAGVLLAQSEDQKAIDIIFEHFLEAPEGQSDGIAKLSAEMLIRSGQGNVAAELLMAKLIQ